MRTLSPTLLAAQRSLGSVPSVRLRVEDRELHWQPLLDDDSSTRLTAACTTSGAILRARIGAAGTVDLQRVTAPSEPTQWQAWSTLVSGAAPTSDVAISAVEGDPGRVRLFFACPDGSIYRLSWVQSEDGGETWSAPADLATGLSTPAGLASANAQLLYHDPGDGYLKLAIREGWEAGPWAIHPWAAGGALATRHGLAAAFASGRYCAATCDEETPSIRRLRTGTYTPATGTWTEPVPIVPPGMPAASFVPAYPSLVYAGDLWHLSYLETVSGALSYAEAAVVHSADWDHWSFACWVPLAAFGPKKRAALACYGQALYLAMECAVWRAATFDPASAETGLATSDVLAYTIEEEPWQGRALVEIHNPGGRYDRPGQAGEPGASIRPLARAILERGYRTAAGQERVERPPYYVVSAAVRRGGPRPALQLECDDGWGLLARWRPDALYAWAGKTIAWLVAEVLYRAAGLSCAFDDAPAWSTVLDAFALAPGNWDDAVAGERRASAGRQMRPGERRPAPAETVRGTALGALRTLLAKASAAARWQPDGSLYCFVPWAQALADPYVIGSEGEILDALYGRGLIIPTEARVFGSGVAASAAAPAALGAPRRYLATYVDPHLETAAACADRVAGLAHDGQARMCLGWIETPCQCGLDLYDLIALDDARAGELSAWCLRAAGIVERYDPQAGAFTSRVTLERA